VRAFNFLLTEAAYDAMISGLTKKYPNFTNEILFAKNMLKRQDRAVWYLTTIKSMLDKTPMEDEIEMVETKSKIQEIKTKLEHYLQQNIPTIQNYIFDKNKTTDQLYQELDDLERAHKSKQDTEKGVEPQKGDYKLIEYPNGFNWWFIDRPYCPEEGRSGKHCGNVAGKSATSERILSFRDPANRVYLTFILDREGSLGEMKAKGNKKPTANFHRAIVDLLLNDKIKNIKSGGYAPSENFSIFDLTPELQDVVFSKKPQLVLGQLNYNPLEIVAASDTIRNSPDVRNFLRRNKPEVFELLNNSSVEQYQKIVARNPEYIVFAPLDLPNYKEILTQAILKKGALLRMAPKQYKNSYEYNKSLLEKNPKLIEFVNINIPKYDELVKTALAANPKIILDLPDEAQTNELWLYVLNQDPLMLKEVPQPRKTPEIQQYAYSLNPDAFAFIDNNLKTNDMINDYISRSNSPRINLIPEEQRVEDIAELAVKKNGENLADIPDKAKTKQMCYDAAKQDGFSLIFVPDKFKDYDVCKAAVENNPDAMQFVPDNIKAKLEKELK